MNGTVLYTVTSRHAVFWACLWVLALAGIAALAWGDVVDVRSLVNLVAFSGIGVLTHFFMGRFWFILGVVVLATLVRKGIALAYPHYEDGLAVELMSILVPWVAVAALIAPKLELLVRERKRARL